MEQQVVLRVRPGETVRFPAQCVACGQPAGERLTLRKRRGQVTRRVEAPLCVDCARQLARRSGQEERLLRLSWPAALVAAALLIVLVMALLPLDSQLLELILAVTIGLVAGIIVWWALVRRAAQAELPEKRAIVEAARIIDYTWRDMTLSFVRADIAERVRDLNAAVAVESAGGGPDTTGGASLVNEPPA